jgi:flavin-dependent dehydrogenase
MTAAAKFDIICVGGSLGGMIAARIISELFPDQDILIIESRNLEEDAHVAQCLFPHNLTAKAWKYLFSLFPELRQDLVDAGCAQFQWSGRNFTFRMRRGHSKPLSLKNEGFGITRSLLEGLIRKYISDLERVKIMPNCSATGLLISEDQISGVTAKLKSEKSGQEQEFEVEASLVVISTGANTQLHSWLDAADQPTSDTVVIDGRIRYYCCEYIHPEDRDPESVALYDRDIKNRVWYSAGRVDIPNNHFYIMISGIAGHNPGKSIEEFNKALGQLISPELKEYAARSTQLPKTLRVIKAVNKFFEYHKLPFMPGGLVVFGDAQASLNPFYGLGVTNIVEMAKVLEKYLKKHGYVLSPTHALKLQKKIALSARPAWILSIVDDMVHDPSWNGTVEQIACKVMARYKKMIFNAMVSSGYVSDRFVEVAQGRHFIFLANPIFAAKVIWHQLFR